MRTTLPSRSNVHLYVQNFYVQELPIYALAMVVAMLVFALLAIYGGGAICFAWWDGGIVRRLLMLLCAAALGLATMYAVRNRQVWMPHSSVTRRT